MELIYLDHNATTPLEPGVAEAMRPYMQDVYGNASSVHSFGRDAKVALETAREQIAQFIGCGPQELYFTSGGTESNNMAIIGAARNLSDRKTHIVIGATEHHAALEPAEHLHNTEGWQLDLLPVDSEGVPVASELTKLVTDNTALVSVMTANSETGAIADIAKLSEVAHEQRALFHTDAVQAVGKIEVDVNKLGIDLLSLNAHKIYGPKGVGALFIGRGVKLQPLFFGGAHEKKRRPGTENVAGAVGLAKTLEIAGRRMKDDWSRIEKLADHFISRVTTEIPDVIFNGPRTNRIVQTVNFSFCGAEGESIVLSLDMEGIAVSSGSACTSGSTDPSHVLLAMGVDAIDAQGGIRFSLGRSTTREQLDTVVEKLVPVIERLRKLSPVYGKTK